MIESLGTTPTYVGSSRFYQLAVVNSPDVVKSVQPDFRKMSQLPTLGVIVTAKSNDDRFDFVSRFFAPAMGVDEDPVCGSAHCCLAPYWSEKLGKTNLVAYQASARGGILWLRYEGDRVILGGKAAIVWRGDCFC
jgi:predicted PhzF superfamily epimerase YddE/YHI9